jgi:diguanylate cyclase (GGDEF)-like protein/PAS domain S-box-containing protein
MLLAVATTVGQVAVATGLVATVVAPAASLVAATATFVLAASGVLTAGLAVHEREAAEAALARTDARLRALMDASSDVLTVADGSRALTYVSPAGERTLGRAPRSLVGTDLLGLVDPEHRARVTAEIDRVVAGGTGTHGSIDVLVVLPTLERRWYEWSIRNLLGDQLVEGLVIEQRDITERLAHQVQLAHAATHDELTGLPNRAGLLERLAGDLDGAVPGAGVAVLFLDLDRFKEVNDTHGHQAGDEVLVSLGRRLRSGLRPHDHLARISGDEFCAILTEVHDRAEVEAVIERLCDLCDQPVRIEGGALVEVGVSIGVALAFAPARPESLFAEADDDMYRVKRTRRWRALAEVEAGRAAAELEAGRPPADELLDAGDGLDDPVDTVRQPVEGSFGWLTGRRDLTAGGAGPA